MSSSDIPVKGTSFADRRKPTPKHMPKPAPTRKRRPTPKARPKVTKPKEAHPKQSPRDNRLDQDIDRAAVISLSIVKPGRVVVRPDDLLHLRIEIVNLTVKPGAPPQLMNTGTTTGYIILHFPPQAIGEEAFFQSAVRSIDGREVGYPTQEGNSKRPAPTGTETPRNPPVRARIADGSRLVFKVPRGVAFEYTLKGILDACTNLVPSIVPHARPPVVEQIKFDLIAASSHLTTLSPLKRLASASQIVRALRIARVDAKNATPDLLLRVTGSSIVSAVVGAKVSVEPMVAEQLRPTLRLSAPTPTQTAIEMPLRMLLSPHGRARWVHASGTVTSRISKATELWHTRLGTLVGTAITEEPRPTVAKTVRAIWARQGEGSKPFDTDPAASPKPSDSPFRTSLDDNDRFNIVHLSSNFSLGDPPRIPEAIDCKAFMLSSLGAWLDSRAAFDVPSPDSVGRPRLSVEEWVHQASMARDSYVRVVYKGFLFPFGHRVSLIKVTERKFHNTRLGKPAYLRQRMYIVVRERERQYTSTLLNNGKSGQERVLYHHKWPFSRVAITTTVTPDLDAPPPREGLGPENGTSRQLFWPCVGGEAFRFHCVAMDYDGRNVEFLLPMVFLDNSLGAHGFSEASRLWDIDANGSRRRATLAFQRVALAMPRTSGETTCEVHTIEFGGETENLIEAPQCYPSITAVEARLPAIAHLAGGSKLNLLRFNQNYLAHGFDEKENPGEVFVDIDHSGANAELKATLDFSTQGDRSGGFLMPNLKPSGISRLTGPIAGDVSEFGKMASFQPGSFFRELSPTLFGVIPLKEILYPVEGLHQALEKVPQFLSETSNKSELFFGDLIRVLELTSNLGPRAGEMATAALRSEWETFKDLADQAARSANTSAISSQISAVVTELGRIVPIISNALGNQGSLTSQTASLSQKLVTLNTRLSAQPLPAGFRSSVQAHVERLQGWLSNLISIPAMLGKGQAVGDAIGAIIPDPSRTVELLQDRAALMTRLAALGAALQELKGTILPVTLLEGPQKRSTLVVIDSVLDALEEVEQLAELLAGEELIVRFDWKPRIKSWNSTFRANDEFGLLVAVEARIRRSERGEPQIKVVCGLNHFDLILIGDASFLELIFEKVEFRSESSKKMDVDVVLKDIRFVGCLAFVETLRDLIPLKGFSDPPSIDISERGIEASFSMAIPTVAVGVFNLSNVNLSAGFIVPFIAEPVAVQFHFCTREQPFNLTVALFGGGGFFGITVDPSGVQSLEAALEFGASISVDFGVASGGVHAMGGIYFRMEGNRAELTGYFRLGGHVDVLGLITASIELYMDLAYEYSSGKAVGRAELDIEVEVFLFSTTVTIECERKFAGSNGDPTFAQLMGPKQGETLSDQLLYPWREYCEAFA